MYESEKSWRDVEAYVVESLSIEDDILVATRDSARAAGLPDHEVDPGQGKFLWLICQMVGAKGVLEFGTLAGYSTIWFARAVGAYGHATTLEIDPVASATARANLERAGLADRVRLIDGAALDSSRRLVEGDTELFDVVFIDADKPSNPHYLDAALKLTHPGSVIVVDNVVRNGAVIDSRSTDARVQGSRSVIETLGDDQRLDATVLQTVGSKGWDGFAIARVR